MEKQIRVDARGYEYTWAEWNFDKYYGWLMGMLGKKSEERGGECSKRFWVKFSSAPSA